MRVRDLFILPGGRPSGLFLAPQSLVVFSLGTAVVTTVSRAFRTMGQADGESTMVALVTAAVVGSAIVMLTVIHPEVRPQKLSAWALGLVIAALNSFLLYAAAVGIEKF
jgi:hypothetical protein